MGHSGRILKGERLLSERRDDDVGDGDHRAFAVMDP
jgi:hypothetical protein